MQKWFIIFISITIIFQSCAVQKNESFKEQLLKSNCSQHTAYNYSSEDMPKHLHLIPISTQLKSKISNKGLHLANALNILPLLEEYTKLKYSIDSSNTNQKIHLLELKQEISQKINTGSLIVSAVSSEMDCEEERTSQIANYLEGKQSELESKLTIGAIVVGASGAIATGGTINNEKLSNTIGISTGIAEASLGLMMLFNKNKSHFYHERNALQEIWEGKSTSMVFPPFIWYYLNYSPSNDTAQKSIREQIIDKWKSFGQIEDSDKNEKLKNLYFGKGGVYNADQLNNRADMYDQLESHINLLKQDLMSLMIEIENI